MRLVPVFKHLVVSLTLFLLTPLSVHANVEANSPTVSEKSLHDQFESLISTPINNASNDFLEAVRLYQGAGVPMDRPKAYRYFISAAEQGNIPAQYVAGWMYRVGEGVTKRSYIEATRWFGKAAEEGHLEAMFTLGTMYDFALEMPADRNKALYWYKKAAVKGHARSQVNLGAMYHNQIGDHLEAYHWFREAAKSGNSLAEYNLGLLYLNGEGVIKNFVMAERWFSKAAQVGSSLAQYELGRMYQYGIGVKKDLKEAISWYERAASQGHRKSKEILEDIK